jgi:hypothetical protein
MILRVNFPGTKLFVFQCVKLHIFLGLGANHSKHTPGCNSSLFNDNAMVAL